MNGKRLTIWIVAWLALLPAVWCAAQVADNELPEIAKDIGVDDRVGEMIDMDVSFTDDKGNFVRMKDLFKLNRPLMLSFNYSNCPKLCSVQLENMTLALRDIEFKIGEDFELVSVSIDPLEQISRARSTKEKFMQFYNKPESADGWHFLVGKEDAIKYLADQCGFRYKYVRHQKLYSHPPVFILVSPKGKIVRYIHGLDYESKTIEQALVEAAEGKIGSAINWFSYSLGCYVYDETSGKYSIQAMVFMRLGGLATIIILLGTLVPYWFMRKGASNKVNEVSDSQEPVATETKY